MTGVRVRWPVGAAIAAVLVSGSLLESSRGIRDFSQPGAARLQYDRAEDDARAEVDAAARRYGAESLEAISATDALIRALLRNGRGWSPSTLTLAQHTLNAKERRFGKGHADLVGSLTNAGDALVAAAEYDEGVALLERAFALQQQAGGPIADVLDRLGFAYTAASRYDDALRVLARSQVAREQSPVSITDLARTLELVGGAAQAAGNYDRAGPAVRRAQDLRRQSDSTDPAFVDTLNLVAQQLWFEGDLPGSRRASEQAVELGKRVLRPTHPLLLEAMRYLAGTLTDLGDLRQSHDIRVLALQSAESEYGEGHFETAGYLNSLGIAERRLGQYSNARNRFERALRAAVAKYGPNHDLVATLRLNLAIVNVSLGDFSRARSEFSQASAAWESAGGRNHPFVAVALGELATAFMDESRPREALPLLQRALAIRERNLGPNHPDVAGTLVELAGALAATGQVTRAQQLATRAVTIWSRLDTPDAPEFATVLALYADLQARRGDLVAARDYYERALAIRAKVFGESNPLYAEAQVGLASALAKLGDSTALSMAAQAEARGLDHLHLMLRSLPERQALNYAAARPRGLNLIFSLATVTPAAVPEAVDGLIKSRALVLDEIAARRDVGRDGEAAADAARTAMTSAQQRLANLLVRGPGSMLPTQYASLVDTARQESEAAEQALAEQSADFRAERSRAQIGADQVSTALPADGALVSIARYDRTPLTVPGAPPAGIARAPARVVPSYIAFVLRPGRPPAAVPLGSVQAIDTLVSEWRVDIAAEAAATSSAQSETARTSRASGLALRRRVWDRLVEHIGDARRVFVVPDGSLSLVPFAALPTGQRSFLLERGPVIHYLSAERDVVPAPGLPSASGGLLAIGGPSFDDRSVFRGRARPTAPVTSSPAGPTVRGGALPCGGLQSITFQPLTGTRQEVRDLSALWPAESGLSQMLIGRDASEAAFKREAAGHRVLHLATHGFFLNGDCAVAPTGTRGVGGLASAGARRPAENPLLLSGLALAGANRRASAAPDEDDGILTAEEVASLDLSGVEWAVLSACDTGVGEIRAGEGVFGLRRAFQVAGARTVVMSLWSVDDQATRAWMRALYEGRFQRQLSTADAVHEASLSMLRDRRAKGLSTHPFYWAAFVAAGDWR